MASYFYNGVLLPEIPSDVLKNYPYCWIRYNIRTGHYDLFMAKSPWWQSDSTTIYTASYADGIQWYRTPITEVGDDWTAYQTWTTNGGMANESDRAILWANHNIPVGAVTATTIYFVGSSAIPDVESYQIKKDTVVAIADQVRRLCKTEATLTPAQMESNLEGLNIELMDLYVTSTTEDVTYTPEEGYYGFSKVVVGGVDFGGGGGSGGGGAVSGGAAEDTTFGDDYYNVPTGNYDYSAGADENPFYIPEIPGDGYRALFSKKLKAGRMFRYGVSGTSYDLQADSDVYVYAAVGAYYSWNSTNGNVRTNLIRVIVCSGTESTTFRTKLTTESEWSLFDTSTKVTDYSDLYCAIANQGSQISAEGWSPDDWDNDHDFQVTGIPCFNVGAHEDETAVISAMHAYAAGAGDEGSDQFVAFVSETQILYDGSVITNADNSPMTIYECDSSGENTWSEIGTTDGTAYPVGNYTLVWNSHDLKDMAGQYVTQNKSDDPIAEMSEGETGVPVERNETYTIEGNTMNTFVSSAQKVTGDKTPLTPTEAALALDDYYANQAEGGKW